MNILACPLSCSLFSQLKRLEENLHDKWNPPPFIPKNFLVVDVSKEKTALVLNQTRVKELEYPLKQNSFKLGFLSGFGKIIGLAFQFFSCVNRYQKYQDAQVIQKIESTRKKMMLSCMSLGGEIAGMSGWVLKELMEKGHLKTCRLLDSMNYGAITLVSTVECLDLIHKIKETSPQKSPEEKIGTKKQSQMARRKEENLKKSRRHLMAKVLLIAKISAIASSVLGFFSLFVVNGIASALSFSLLFVGLVIESGVFYYRFKMKNEAKNALRSL